MGERVATWFAAALLAVVAGTSYWYSQYLRAQVDVDAGRIGTIDFFADGIALTGFDDAGRPRYRLFADHLTHFGTTDDVDLDMPRVLSLRTDQPQVQAVARSAHGTNNAELIQMRGNVVLTRAADGARPPMRMDTEELTVAPDDDHFWTQAPVQVHSGRDVVTGRGMDFDNIARRVELHNDVTGTFYPRSPKCVRCP